MSHFVFFSFVLIVADSILLLVLVNKLCSILSGLYTKLDFILKSIDTLTDEQKRHFKCDMILCC